MPLSGTIGRGITSDHRIHHGRWVGPASYATGGETGMASALDLPNRIESLPIFAATNAAGTLYIAVYNPTTDSLVWYDTSGVEIVAGTDLSGFSGDFIAIGI